MYIHEHTGISYYISVFIITDADILIYTGIYQVKLINRAIDKAKVGSCLHGLPHVADPSNDVADVLIQCMDWNIASRQSRAPEGGLPELQDKAVTLLDILQWNLPDKTGEKGISRRSTAFCTRSGRSYYGVMCILRFHARAGYLQI